MSDKTVKRKIYYYDLTLKLHENNKKNATKLGTYDQGEKIKEIFLQIKEKQDNLAFTTSPSEIALIQKDLEMTLSNHSKLYIIVDEISDSGIIKFRIVLCRNNAFPYVYKNGKLELLTENVNGKFELAEITHCVIFADSMIMGGEFNFHGSRPSAIATYISYKISEVAFLECSGKLNNDSINKIVEGKPFALFDLSIRNSEDVKNRLAANQFIIETWLKGIPEDTEEYEIILKKKRGAKNKGFESPLTNEQYKKLVNDFREDISKLKISQGIQRDAIDLLNDKLVHSLPISVETMDKTIISEYMYNEIENFYHNVIENFKERQKNDNKTEN